MSVRTWLDDTVAIRPAATLSALDYMAGDGTDETAGFRELFAAAEAVSGDVAVYFPAPSVSYHIVSDAIDGDNPAVVGETRGGILIYGDGKGNTDGTGTASTIYWTGVEKMGDFGDAAHSSRQLIWKFTDKARVVIRDLRIVGDNGVLDEGFVSYGNNQSTPIDIAHVASATAGTDMLIRDVGFYNLVGYAGHTTGAHRRCALVGCDFQYCANGPNFNAGNIIYYRNKFVRSEGIEASGRPGVIALNDGAALSLGGSNTQNTSLPGVLAVGNTRKATGGSDSDIHITAAESYTDGWIQGNVVEAETGDCVIVGATVGQSGTFLYDRCAIVNNHLAGRRGVGLQESEDHLVADNDLTGSNLSAFALAECVGSDFRGNTLHGNALVNDHASDIGWEDNTFASGRLVDVGSVTVEKDAPAGVETKIYLNLSFGFLTLQVRNWSEAESISIPAADLESAGVTVGDRFHFLHPYDLLGAPYHTAVYVGRDVRLNMRAVAPPDDWTVSTTQPLPTLGPKFNAFVLVRAGDVRDDPLVSPYIQSRIHAIQAATQTLRRQQ